MTTFGARTFIAIIVWATSQTSFATAQPLPDQTASLQNLGSLRVEVVLSGASDEVGLAEPAIRSAVESRLQQAGVRVRSDSDPIPRDDPRLRITLQPINAAGGYAFLVSVQVLERVIAYRKYVELVFDGILPTTPTASVEPLEIGPAIRWELQALGTTRREGVRTFIPDAMLGYVDRFIDDYTGVNPR